MLSAYHGRLGQRLLAINDVRVTKVTVGGCLSVHMYHQVQHFHELPRYHIHGPGGVPSRVMIHQSGQQAQSFFCLHLNQPSGVEALSTLCTLVVQITVR